MVWKTFDFKGGRTRLGRKMGEILEGDKFKCNWTSSSMRLLQR